MPPLPKPITSPALRRILSPLLIVLILLLPPLAPAVKAKPQANIIVVSTTIQAAVDAASPGDIIYVPPGTYPENVQIDKDNLTIEGSPAALMDGTGLMGATGIHVAPGMASTQINGFSLSGMQIQNYRSNGVLLEFVDNFRLRHGTYANNARYGIFPVRSSHGLIEFNSVSGSADTAIYVGQSDDVSIGNNQSTSSTVGINVENSARVDIQRNYVGGNAIGILVDFVPNGYVTVTRDISVTGNMVTGNNRPNSVTSGADLLSYLPSGSGIVNVGGDNVAVGDNSVTWNNSAGIYVLQLPPSLAAEDHAVDPYPDHNRIRNNISLQNGLHPDPKLSPLPGSDLLWDSSGSNNCWAGNAFSTSYPLSLPVCPVELTIRALLPLLRR